MSEKVRCHCPPGTDCCPLEDECFDAWQKGELVLVRGDEEFESAVKHYEHASQIQRWAGPNSPDSRGREGLNE